jgi:K+-transporting ATPase ATPase C chain
MNITKNLLIAVLMTVVTTLLLGVAYPLVVTGLAQAFFPDNANGQLIEREPRSSAPVSSAALSPPGYSQPGVSGGHGLRRDELRRDESRADQ